MGAEPPRILIVLANAEEVPFFVMLAGMLEERGVEVHFLATEYTIRQQAWKLGRRAPNVMNTALPGGRPRKHVEGVSLEDVCRYVLDHPSLDVRYLTLFEQADRLVRAYKHHFDRIRPQLVMSWNGTIPRIRAAMKLAEARNIRTLYFEQGNFPGTVICDPQGVNYEGSMRDFEVPLDYNRRRIEGYLKSFRERKRPTRPFSAASGPLFEPSLVDAVVNFFARRTPFHATLHFDHDMAVDTTRFLRRLRQHVKMHLGYHAEPAARDIGLPKRFVFLPLQVQADTQIIVHSPLVRMMEELVDETVRALPEQYDLVVKSHPADEGRRGYRVIEEILEEPRYHFLHGGDTLEIIRRSSCVVTVNSTVGLEALALMKPVLVLGHAVYADRGITVELKDLASFGPKLRETLRFRPDPDRVKRFLDYYIFEYAKPGDFRKPNRDQLRPLADYVFGQLDAKRRARAAPAPAKTEPTHLAEEARPLVSVIMPAYNVADFIAQAIESVLRQTYTRWELLIIDDGSTDATPEVIDRYRDGRIRRFRTANRGLAAARNYGLERARGELIAFLDSDDLWFPDKLDVQVGVLERERNVGLVYSNVWRISENGRRLSTHRFALSRLPHASCLDSLLVRNGVVAPSTVMLRQSVMEKAGAFEPTLRAVEDWDLWWRAALHFDFGYVARPLAAYRIRTGALTGRYALMDRSERAVIQRAFSHDEVRRRFQHRELKRLRRRAEAVHLYNAGARQLRAGEVRTAATSFLRSLATSPYDVRQIAMLLISLTARIPFVDRDYLLDAVRK